jgi:hypothetical protein
VIKRTRIAGPQRQRFVEALECFSVPLQRMQRDA